MEIREPDPDPGRCLNYRYDWRGPKPGSIRCLDYEGHKGACIFLQRPSPVTVDPVQDNTQWVASTNVRPTPWVSPLDGKSKSQTKRINMQRGRDMMEGL